MLCFTKLFFVLLVFIHFGDGSFRCDYKYSTVAKGWFTHVVAPMTWEDARLWCSLQNAQLASPTTIDMLSEMTLLMKAYFWPDSEVWTGIHATVSPGVFRTIDGKPLSEVTAPWAEHGPKGRGNCLTFTYNGSLTDKPCKKERHPYICFRPHTDTKINQACRTVDPEYQFDPSTNKCYKFHTVARNFSRANFACSAEGAHLVILNSRTEALVLKNLFSNYTVSQIMGPNNENEKHYALAGFYDWNERGDWRTIHGETLNEAGYTTFKSGEPNNKYNDEYCGSVNRQGYLNDISCHTYHPFICEKDPANSPLCEGFTDRMPR